MSGLRAQVVDEALTRALRRAVLRPNLPPDAPLPGDDLPDGVHLGVVVAGSVISTCFVYRDDCPWRPARAAWHLRQMATDPAFRGQGAGAAVLAAAEGLVRERGADLLWCNARATAESFYAAHGWQAVGEIFTDERHSIPHRRMERALPSDPSDQVCG